MVPGSVVFVVVEADGGNDPRADIGASPSFAATDKLKTDFKVFVLHVHARVASRSLELRGHIIAACKFWQFPATLHHQFIPHKPSEDEDDKDNE
jgi:hypothetical protein